MTRVLLMCRMCNTKNINHLIHDSPPFIRNATDRTTAARSVWARSWRRARARRRSATTRTRSWSRSWPRPGPAAAAAEDRHPRSPEKEWSRIDGSLNINTIDSIWEMAAFWASDEEAAGHSRLRRLRCQQKHTKVFDFRRIFLKFVNLTVLRRWFDLLDYARSSEGQE